MLSGPKDVATDRQEDGVDVVVGASHRRRQYRPTTVL